ncbi:MAG: ribbon-helix-helix protein, CopG family [Vampirovibrionales bacterium]|nr:ribbon-helix-helix protein, CopG family [Vampirovibrionales bacterium]
MAKVDKEIVTFRLKKDMKEALDEVAASMQRDRSFVLSEAVTLYLDVHQWHIDDARKGLEEAQAGKFASETDVREVLRRWITDEDTLDSRGAL